MPARSNTGLDIRLRKNEFELSPSRKGAVNWIDAHPEFGIGRPYLDKDPAHVAPIDGKEYADHRKPKSAMRLLAKISHTLMNCRTATSGAEATAEVKH